MHKRLTSLERRVECSRLVSRLQLYIRKGLLKINNNTTNNPGARGRRFKCMTEIFAGKFTTYFLPSIFLYWREGKGLPLFSSGKSSFYSITTNPTFSKYKIHKSFLLSIFCKVIKFSKHEIDFHAKYCS